MNIYLISQDFNTGYDTYDSAVVVANNPEEARKVHPSEYVTHNNGFTWMGTYSGKKLKGDEYENEPSNWVKFSEREDIEVKFIGETKRRDSGVILASFNAG